MIKISPRRGPRLACASLFLLVSRIALGASPTTALAPAWTPVSPQELAQKAPLVEPDADAEAIFWDVKIEDSREITGTSARTDTWNHVRVKIFTERGKEAWTRLDVPYEGRARVSDLAARTIQADGSIVEAGSEAVSDRTLVKGFGTRVKAKSIAAPGVGVGSLVEFRWREIEPDPSFFMHLTVEREIPVQKANFAFKPLDVGGWDMQTHTFGVQPGPFKRDKDGFSTTSVENVHSVRAEPLMPPADTLRGWILVSYTNQKEGTPPDTFWKDFGKRVIETYKDGVKASGDVKKAAADAVGTETDAVKKLRNLFELCRAKIKNVDAPGAKVTYEERAKLVKDETGASALSAGKATSTGVNLAFAALASAAGFEVRLARVGDRSSFFFDPQQTSSYFLRRQVVAVKVGEAWLFLSPGAPEASFDLLPWQLEGQKALLCDAKDSRFADVPAAPPEKNVAKRSAKFRLAADGALEGTVRVELSGQAAAAQREALGEKTAEEVEKGLREELAERIAGAEVSAVAIEARDDPERPLVTTYQVRVPGYATRAGSRLLLPASWFRKGRAPLFPTSKRLQSVFFPYGATEEDEVLFELPEKMAPEELPSPLPVRTLAGKLQFQTALAVEGRTLKYTRSTKLPGGVFGVADYAAVKKAFDRMQSTDELTIALATP